MITPLEQSSTDISSFFQGRWLACPNSLVASSRPFAQYKSEQIVVTRLARGIPVGSDLEYVDGTTIAEALSGRREM